MEVILI